MDDAKLFIPPERKSSFQRSFCNRRIYNGRRVNLTDFGASEITAMIEAMGWTPIICMDNPIFPRLVRLFYCNLEFDKAQPSITSLVNGTVIRLTCDSLGAMLGIPNEGVRHYRAGGWGKNDREIMNALRLVCEDDEIRTCYRPHYTSLPTQNRLLHSMVMSIFLPRGGHRDRVSRMDLFLLMKILCKEKVNLPYMIIHHMVDNLANKHLPYGLLLSKIFLECNVHIGKDEFFERLKWKEVYNWQSLDKMGFVKTDAGWKPKEELVKGDLDDDGAMEGEEEEEELEEDDRQRIVQMVEERGDLSNNGQHKRSTSNEELEEDGVTMVRHEADEDKEDDRLRIVVMDEEQGDLSNNGWHKSSTGNEAEDIHGSPRNPSARVDIVMEEITQGSQEKQEDRPSSVMDGAQGESSFPADSVYESLRKLSAKVDTLALSIENLRCQQENGFANLAGKLDNLIEFMNGHFWPYPPPPSPFAG